MKSHTELTDSERNLLQKSDLAVNNGLQVLEWWKRNLETNRIEFFDLQPATDTRKMKGFFSSLFLNSQNTSIMGCIQSLRFACTTAEGEPCTLDTYVSTRFMRDCIWKHPDGLPGGFGYEALFYKDRDGNYVRAEPAAQIDITDVGKKYEWALLKVDIHDFIRSFGPLQRFSRTLSGVIREAAYIVVHPEFKKGVFEPSAGVLDYSGLGYSFVPELVHSSFFGFGPGRFGAALKMIRFSLLETRQIEISLTFLVAPRSQKVFSFWGFDPVYSSVDLMDKMSLGVLGIGRGAHDYLDRVMLRQHGDVHQNLIEDMRTVWEKECWAFPMPAGKRKDG